jgi:hypothetical protein
MKKQDKILRKIASDYGLSIKVAEEIYTLFTQQLVEIISHIDKKTDDQYDPDKFSTIHIDQFGKFVPNLRNIRHANFCLENKRKYKIKKKIV